MDFIPLFMETVPFYISAYVFPFVNISGFLFRKQSAEFYSYLYEVMELLLQIFLLPWILTDISITV